MDTAIFFIGKLLGMLTRAEIWVLLLLLGLVQLLAGKLISGRRWVTMAILLFVILATIPIGTTLIQPLEYAHERPDDLPPRVDGIIVLGGAEDGYGPGYDPMLNSAGERLTETLFLASHYPEAAVIFTGGSGSVLGHVEGSGVDWARRFFEHRGIVSDRMILEGASRTTAENAILTHQLVQPKAGSIWILVTSAAHMKRSMASFERAGWPGRVTWPTDYRIKGGAGEFKWDLDGKLEVLNSALHEYPGLIAYWALGR